MFFTLKFSQNISKTLVKGKAARLEHVLKT
uniref:Uncharacterized protein n=1 Tax=Anguilla anguilla TaxID=7936 RepID=A0A0E9TX81_ANGAN